MKKHILNLFLCATLVSTVSSCRDALDIVQEGELIKENVFKSPDDLKRFLDGDIYTRLNINSAIRWSALFTDEVGIGPSFSGFSQDIHQFYVDTSTGEASSIWLTNYGIINRVAYLLDGATLVQPSGAQAIKDYNSFIGEARAARAFAYIQLLMHYSTDMSDADALGVIILDHIPTIDEQLPRSKNSDVWAVIEEDLNFAEANVVDRDATQYYLTKNAIAALKARFYLYTKKYDLAKQYAQKVIDNSGLTLTKATPTPTFAGNDQFGTNWHRFLNYDDTTPTPYNQMLRDVNRGEVVFAISNPINGYGSNIAGLFTTNASNATGGVQYDMGRNLFNEMRAINGDIRKYAFIDYSSKILAGESYLTNANYKANDVLVIDKYPGKNGAPLRNDVKVFRLSEMYFILAEVAVQNNNLDLAADYIFKVREARNFKGNAVKATYASKDDAIKAILLERRIELAFEGHRFIDLKRLGSTVGLTQDRSIIDAVTKEIPLNIPVGDYRWTLPISRNELQGNSVIQQNPGYATTP